MFTLRHVRHIGLLAAVAMVTNCASCEGSIKLEYASEANRCMTKSRTISVDAFDRRPRGTRTVGIKKSGFNSDKEPVRLDYAGGLTQWVSDAIKKDLIAAGFKVASNAPTRIVANVREFFVEPRGMWMFGTRNHALVLIELTVALPDGSEYARIFKGYKTASGTSQSDSGFEMVLIDAAGNALNKAARELCTLFVKGGRRR